MIDTKKLNLEQMRRVAEEHGVSLAYLAAKAANDQQVYDQVRLDAAEYLRTILAVRYPEDDVLECSRCGFESPDSMELPTCPGCGVAFGSHGQPMGEGEPMQEAKAQVVDISAQRPGRAVREAQTPEPEAAPPKKASTSTAKAAKQQEEAEAKAAQTRQAEAKAKKKLEDLGKKIDKELATQAGSAWRIGKHLSEVYRQDLWQADPGEDYKSFADYAQRRFQFGKDSARGYLRIAETFTEKAASEMSVSRLWWLARVEDDGERAELATQVKSGELRTVRDLIDAVKVKRAEAGLNTERRGLEGTVALSGRIKAGHVVAEGEFTQKGKKMYFDFELGGTTFRVVANEQDYGVEVRHVKDAES